MGEPFTTCEMCGRQWNTLEEFAMDYELCVNAYSSDFGNSEDGLIVLTHTSLTCGSAMCIDVGRFREWRTETSATELCMQSGACPGRCLESSDLEPCTNECSMRWVRDVLQLLKAHKVPEQALITVRASMNL